MGCIKREFPYTRVRVAMTEWLPYRLVMEERVYSVDPASRVRLGVPDGQAPGYGQAPPPIVMQNHPHRHTCFEDLNAWMPCCGALGLCLQGLAG